LLILLPFAWLPFSLIIHNKNYGNVGWIAELNGSKERLTGQGHPMMGLGQQRLKSVSVSVSVPFKFTGIRIGKSYVLSFENSFRKIRG
jgi:hypothetical protein